MNNSVRRKQRITALSLVLTMLMGGCGGKQTSSFELIENKNNELVAADDSYISNDYIKYYYVVEVYNKLTNENEIYIGRNYMGSTSIFFDVFTGLEMSFDDKSIFKYVNSTGLSEYILSYDLGQVKYSYEDMKKIYEMISESYAFDSNKTLTKKREIN